MIRPVLKSIAAATALAVALWAAPFWTAKPYTQWTEKEVEKVLGNSPWVQSAEVSFDMSGMPQGGMRGAGGGMGGPGGGMGGPGGGMGGSGGGMGGPGGGMGGPGGGMGGPGGGMGGPGGGMGGPGGGMGGPGGGMQMPSAYVMWQSSLTVRRAMVRAAQLKESPAAPELEKQLDTPSTHHILAVMGLQGGPGMMRRPGGDGQPGDGQGGPSPQQMAEMRARMETQMKENTTLTIDGRKLSPEKIETVLSGTDRILMFYFAKESEFNAKSKTMQFQTQMGPLKVLAKFKPKDMLE
ncbi:MAG: hypothetical protein KIT83_20405 [Bryobacterales bacterium]|nr:hypothetical protein [Bryobacterales bacterium]